MFITSNLKICRDFFVISGIKEKIESELQISEKSGLTGWISQEPNFFRPTVNDANLIVLISLQKDDGEQWTNIRYVQLLKNFVKFVNS